MLRKRIQEWRIDTKNKRSGTSGKKFTPKNSLPSQQKRETITEALMNVKPESALQSFAGHALQRELLCSFHHYFDYAWRSRLEVFESSPVAVLLHRIDTAITVAAAFQSKAGWTALRNAERDLQTVNWFRVRPEDIQNFIYNLLDWADTSNDITFPLRNLIKDCLSSTIG